MPKIQGFPFVTQVSWWLLLEKRPLCWFASGYIYFGSATVALMPRRGARGGQFSARRLLRELNESHCKKSQILLQPIAGFC